MPTERILGLDVARALAIFEMVIVNFDIVLVGHLQPPEDIGHIACTLSGKAAAPFFLLAGIGVSLLSTRARLSNDPGPRHRTRVKIWRRAALLLVIGLALTLICTEQLALTLYVSHVVVVILPLAARSSTRRDRDIDRGDPDSGRPEIGVTIGGHDGCQEEQEEPITPSPLA